MAKKHRSAETISRAERFLALYRSNPRSTGRFDPDSGKMHTDYEEAKVADVARHLDGEFGVGLVPILDDDTCQWAAIDIDNHGQNEDIPIGPVDEKISAMGVPLVACRSKSGGIHVYYFLEKPIPAAKVRARLTEFAERIGYPKAEIFPKQARLAMSGGKKQLGNWINLPYLGGDDTVRYAYKNGRRLGIDEFLALAEKSRVTAEAFSTQPLVDHPQAPPCVQRMMVEGVGKGQRNEALYNIVVYLRKSEPDNYSDRARSLNHVVFDAPLGRSELERTIISAGRPDYRYRCNEEPIKSLCDRETCTKRKFGITAGEYDEIDKVSGLPEFSSLVKYLTDPVRWEFKVDGKMVTNISTAQLLDWRFVREVCAERLTKVLPMIKPQEWERLLQGLMASARIEEAPEDASTAGIIRARMKEFASKARDLHMNGSVPDRQALLRGLPITYEADGVKQIAFRAQDFVNYLKRTKSEELKGVNLWFATREMGLQTTKLRVSTKKTVNVWFLPYDEVIEDRADDPEFRSEL
jgi:hypothetical protein